MIEGEWILFRINTDEIYKIKLKKNCPHHKHEAVPASPWHYVETEKEGQKERKTEKRERQRERFVKMWEHLF